ncbi:MAG: hypothetical protein ACYDHH_14290 [Solirubrobacteraceae bacterium]
MVANVTADAPELREALQTLAQRGPATFELVVPASYGGSREHAEETLVRALASLQAAGLEASGSVGSADPIIAVSEAWDPKRFDEIIVSTLPLSSSKWLHAGLPERIAKLTGAPVAHVVSRPVRPTPQGGEPPSHADGNLVAAALSFMRLET